MDLDEIKALIDAMGASDLSEMEVGKDGWTLRLVRSVASVAGGAPEASASRGPGGPASLSRRPASPRASAASSGRSAPSDEVASRLVAPPILAPLSGVVYFSAAPGEPAFVEVGCAVEAGAVVCVIEAMKIFNEIRAPHSGTVRALSVRSGDEVDAGQVLLEID